MEIAPPDAREPRGAKVDPTRTTQVQNVRPQPGRVNRAGARSRRIRIPGRMVRGAAIRGSNVRRRGRVITSIAQRAPAISSSASLFGRSSPRGPGRTLRLDEGPRMAFVQQAPSGAVPSSRTIADTVTDPAVWDTPCSTPPEHLGTSDAVAALPNYPDDRAIRGHSSSGYSIQRERLAWYSLVNLGAPGSLVGRRGPTSDGGTYQLRALRLFPRDASKGFRSYPCGGR